MPMISKPESSMALAMEDTELTGVFLCSIVTTEVTTLGDTQIALSPHVSCMTALIDNTHDGQCKFDSKYEVMSLCCACGEDGSGFRVEPERPRLLWSLLIGFLNKLSAPILSFRAFPEVVTPVVVVGGSSFWEELMMLKTMEAGASLQQYKPPSARS